MHWTGKLRSVGQVVSPLRDISERARATVRAAAVLEEGDAERLFLCRRQILQVVLAPLQTRSVRVEVLLCSRMTTD